MRRSASMWRSRSGSVRLRRSVRGFCHSRENCLSPASPDTFPFLQSLTSPDRTFLMDAHVHLKTGLQTQERHLFLFTDILVIAKSKSPSHFKLKQRVRLCEVWTASCMEEVCEGSTNAERSFVVGWPTTNCVATFSSPEQKEKWLSCLLSRIAAEKENDHPKSLPLKILAKAIGSSSQTKTLNITNSETARDVIKTALQQFGVTGSVTDYQLWVISGKDDAPYPLIGHEHPYEIKMSHIRDAMPQTQGMKDGHILDPFGNDRTEHMPRETQCQFILKPSRITTAHPLNDLNQKPFKRRRSIINWAFWRGPGAQLDTQPTSPTSAIPGRLFGLPLSAICENDNLPRPVLDMLSFLYQEGPFTKGIFRRSANAKSCRELKEKLDAEADVDMAGESIFATASVFKDFLRHIPDSILSTQLCEKWVSVLDQESNEDKIHAVQRLMEQLPRANLLLLRYLFGLLQTVEKHAQTNQMTAFNLAICIAPSMLWLPTSATPEVESDFTKKVSVFVQFFIENCSKIFGEDLCALFGDLTATSVSREGSDTCSYQLIDSSYDSLDNELNDDTDSALCNLATKRSPDNRSRDSVLTLSDCELDQSEVDGIELQLPPRSKPLGISTGQHRSSASQEYSENGSLCSNTSGYSSTAVSEALISDRRHRRCSEPIIGVLEPKLSQIDGPHDSAARKTSCDAVMSHSEADYLKQLRSLQVEGQKLIDQSLILGIDVNKGVAIRQINETQELTNHLQPPPSLRLNICMRASCSSLSSPGTSPSGSSMSSMDSAFSQLSDYSAFTPNEISSPLDCPFRLQRKADESPFDVQSANPLPDMHLCMDVISSSKQNTSTHCAGSDALEWPAQRSHVARHPSSWLKSSASTMKNWSIRKKEKASRQDDKKPSSEMRHSQSQNGSCDIHANKLSPENKSLPKMSKAAENVDPLAKDSANLSASNSISLWNSPAASDVEASGGQQDMQKSLTNESAIDKNGVKGVEHSTVSHPSAGETPTVDQKHSQIPETVFYGQNVSLFSQTSKRQRSSMYVMEQTKTHSSSIQSSAEPVSLLNVGQEECVSDRTMIVRGTSTRVASIKRNKVLPSNTNTNYKTPNSGIEKTFCVSPMAANTGEAYFFQPPVERRLQKSKDLTNHATHNKGEWLKNCCSDNTYEETEHRFFAEESYV